MIANLAAYLALLVALSGSEQAQSPNWLTRVTISIVDETGAVIPRATIHLATAPPEGREQVGQTDAQGVYKVDLLPGQIRVRVESPGFRVLVQTMTLIAQPPLTLVLAMTVSQGGGVRGEDCVAMPVLQLSKDEPVRPAISQEAAQIFSKKPSSKPRSSTYLTILVTDPTGPVIPGATVHIGFVPPRVGDRVGQTDNHGVYKVDIPAGLTKIRIDAEGFDPLIRDISVLPQPEQKMTLPLPFPEHPLPCGSGLGFSLARLELLRAPEFDGLVPYIAPAKGLRRVGHGRGHQVERAAP